MTYAATFLRLVVIGTLYDKEKFSFQLSFHRAVDNAQRPTIVPTGVITAITSYWSTVKVSKVAKLERVKLNEIGKDGKYVHPDSVETSLPGNAGISTTVIPAPQLALAVSLRTPLARGRAHAGRYYLPAPSAALVETDGRLSVTSAAEYADGGSYFISNLNAAMGNDWKCSVESNIGSGTYQFVTGVQVGRVYDTIRSRRGQMLEEYKTGVPMSQVRLLDPLPPD